MLVLQAAVEFKTVGNGHAFVVTSLLDERRSLCLFDGSDGRSLSVNLGIVPRGGMQVLWGERSNVGIGVVGGPVADPGADGYGFETFSVRGKKRRNVTAFRPTHRTHTGRVDDSLGDQIVDAAHHVPHVANS